MRPEPLKANERDIKEEERIENVNIQKIASLEDHNISDGKGSREKQPEQKAEEIGESTKGATKTTEQKQSPPQKPVDENTIIKRQNQKANQVKNMLRNNV